MEYVINFLKAVLTFFYFYSDITISGVLYMRRWRFMPDWLPGFRVHNILQSDDDRALHDHPFSFLTIILKGGYYEHLADGTKKWHGRGAILWRPAETLHRIELKTISQFTVYDTQGKRIKTHRTLLPAWTFVLRSRYFRQWGFQTEAGWVHHKDFIDKREGM
jgi:hypothetical protein